jgi:ATP-dependent HslUV protease ATP-binding subunit HslU
VQVEATKFTELGYVGRDVEDIIKDLVEASLSVTRTRLKEALSSHVAAATEDALLDALLGSQAHSSTRDTFR